MNKSYKSVWNESTGSWVAVSELATGRSKSKRAKTAISKAILTQIAVGGMSLAGAGAAMADDNATLGTGAVSSITDGVAIGVNSEVAADTATPTNIGGIAIGDSAYSIGSGVAVGQNSAAGSNSLAFGSEAQATGGGTSIGANSYTINAGGVAIGQASSATGAAAMAIGMNSSASGSNSVALGTGSVATTQNTVSVGNSTLQRRITNVANGTTGTDAVNLSQLTSAGLIINSSGVATNSFVAYTDSTKAQVTFGGTAGTKLSNVANGTTTMDAVNLGQLAAAGLIINSAGVAQNTFVAYDDSTKAQVTFGGTAGTKLSNVANGVTTLDAVNVGQLTAAGLTFSSGVATNSFVAYDDSSKATITLGGGTAGTKITNMKAGAVTAASTDAVNGSQLYNVASSTAAAIGGTAALDPATGKISAPSISVNGATYTDLSSAIAATATLAGTASTNGVQYDTTSHTKITLGGTSSATAVGLTNVAAGVNGTDAVNMAQLNAVSSSFSSVLPTLKYLKFGSSTAQVANALGSDSLALGGNASALASGAISIGLNSSGGNANAVAIGAFSGVSRTALNSVALGYNSQATVSNTVSVGSLGNERTISNVAAGVNANDAVNLSQVETLIGGLSAPKQMVMATRTLGASLGAQAAPQLSDLVAVGTTDKLGSTSAVGTDAVAIGLGAQANNDQASALGTSVVAGGIGATAVGYLTAANGDNAVAIGNADNAKGNNSTSIGVNNDVSASNGVGIGANNTVGLNAANSVAIGSGNTTTGANNVILGTNVTATGTNSVVLGANSQGSQSNVVSVGGTAAGTQRKIVNVAAGTTATDAVNLGQMTTAIAAIGTGGSGGSTLITQPTAGTGDILVGAAVAGTNVNFANSAGVARELKGVANGTADTSAVNLSQLTPAVAALGGGASITGGTFVAPSYTIQGGKAVHNVGDALTELDTGLTSTNAAIAKMGTGLVTQEAAGGDLLVGSKTDGTHVNFATSDGDTRELINVSNGTAATSAVNLSQLTPVVAALGGGASIAGGTFVAPSYTIQDKTYNNAGDAFTKVDGSLTNLTNQVANISGETGKGLVLQDPTTSNITVGALTGGNVVDMTGTAGARLVTGVAAGSLSSSSVDAINGSQLYSVGSSLATAIGGGAALNADGTITQPSFNVGTRTYNNVGDAVTGLDGRINETNTNLENLTTTVTNITAAGIATPNAVAYDSSAHDTLTLTGTSGTKLTNLQNGTLAAGSTDAVTGDQLYTTNQDVAALQNTVSNISSSGVNGIGINGADGAAGTAGPAGATGADAIAFGDNGSASGNAAIAIGGGSTASGDGTIAIGGNAGATGKDSIAIGNGATAPANNAVALGANSVADRDNTVSVGSQGAERQITNVAAGTQGTDAVNLNQMNSAVGGIARKAYSGIAAATALTMIPDVDANKTLSIGIGGGTFQGYAATAIGGTARITQNIKVRVGAGWSAAGTTVGAGASYQW